MYEPLLSRSVPRVTRQTALLAGVAGIGAGVCGIGFGIDAPGFGSNLLAGVVDLAVGVIVAVFLADYLVEARSRARWKQVEAASVGAIADRLQTLRLIVVELVFLPSDAHDSIMGEPHLARALELIAKAIRENRAALASGSANFNFPGQVDYRSSQPVLSEVQPETRYIRESLTPRILMLAADSRLVELLVDLETRERVWTEGVRLVVDDWQYPEEYAWEHAADFYDSASRLAGHIERYAYVDPHSDALRRMHLGV